MTNILSDDEEKRQAVELLSRGVRNCELHHENVVRDGHGNPLPVLQYTSECSQDVQHLGCPHFLLENRGEISRAIALVTGENVETICAHLTQILIDQQKVDNAVRFARIGSYDLATASQIPSTAEGEERAKPSIQKFEQNCQQIRDLCENALALLKNTSNA